MKKNFFKILKNKKGFTLLEIITTVVIISIILATAIPSLNIFIKNGKKAQNLSIAKVIFNSAEVAMQDILNGRHSVEFNTENFQISETGFDNSNYTFLNNSFKINKNSKTPIKIIISKGGYINGLPKEKWNINFIKSFENETVITYDPINKIIKNVSYKGIIYSK